MAQPNGLNPVYQGPVKAEGFVTNLGTVQTLRVHTNGTTKVNVFGATNPFSGSILGVNTIGKDDANGTISLKNNVSGTETTVASIIKGSAGGYRGSALASTVAFQYGGTMTIESSAAAGNVVVELQFTQNHPSNA